MPLLDVFWAMLIFFLWIVWFWLLITVFADIFRSHDLSGWGKAGWTIFVVALPYLGVLVYLIARGRSMQERQRRSAYEMDQATRAYIREAAGTTSTTDELARLAQLHDTGALTDEEYNTQKSRILAV
ncbi:SHOCT domain-containing protein [Egicoccus sp. AB-alg2]|uniref:SHOCT domain-containing protein n=1 Tax=Egicoccus sp. AB-alg2 TaxID=3242693 RepID=UPI00359E377B